MSYQTLILTHDAGIATLTLNRPAARNAFNDALLRELRAPRSLRSRPTPPCARWC